MSRNKTLIFFKKKNKGKTKWIRKKYFSLDSALHVSFHDLSDKTTQRNLLTKIWEICEYKSYDRPYKHIDYFIFLPILVEDALKFIIGF